MSAAQDWLRHHVSGAIARGEKRPIVGLYFAPQYDRPMAAAPLDSYRYANAYGGIAIGARSTSEALREASRSLCSGETPEVGLLQRWNGETWESAQ